MTLAPVALRPDPARVQPQPINSQPKRRRLLDLPGVADLEMKALIKPRHAAPDARAEFPDIDDTARSAFGLTVEAAEALTLALALAMRGLAGELPFQPEDTTPEPSGAGMAADATRFRKR